MTFHEACHIVAAECKDPYAISYANAGLSLFDKDAQACQALYILCNTGQWRGAKAREVKLFLKGLEG